MSTNERKFRLQTTEGELIGLIYHYSVIIQNAIAAGEKPLLEVSERLHDLMKRLHKTGVEIEEAPPKEENSQTQDKVGW